MSLSSILVSGLACWSFSKWSAYLHDRTASKLALQVPGTVSSNALVSTTQGVCAGPPGWLLRLQDAAGNRVTVVGRDGCSVRVCLPFAPASQLVTSALDALRAALPPAVCWRLHGEWLASNGESFVESLVNRRVLGGDGGRTCWLEGRCRVKGAAFSLLLLGWLSTKTSCCGESELGA